MIFISYSHLDNGPRETLLKYLRPLERLGKIDWWADTRLDAGDDWAEKIDAALTNARAAVLLVSQSFLDSPFIVERELPVLLRQQEAGSLRIIPVFLSPSTVKHTPIVIVDAAGHRREINLTKFQGFGSPQKTLADLRAPDRLRAYADLAKTLDELVPGGTASTVAAPRQLVSTTHSQTSPAFTLTVEVQRSGPTLALKYRRPGEDAFLPAKSSSSPALEQELAELAQAFDAGGSRAEEATRHAARKSGNTLFRALFIDEANAQAVLTGLLRTRPDQPAPTPIQSPVHLRICTDDPQLFALPWRLTAWRGELLLDHRWTFTATHEASPTQDISTPTPAHVLVLAPSAETDATKGGALHVDAIKERLARAWPQSNQAAEVRVVRNEGELTSALRGMYPKLMYVYATGRRQGGKPGLIVDGSNGAAAWMGLDTLADRLDASREPVPLVVLNTHELDALELAPLVERLGQRSAAVLWRRLAARREDSARLGISWLSHWLADQGDPGRAMDHCVAAHIRESPEAASWLVHSCHRDWHVEGYVPPKGRQATLLRLDRVQQKAITGRIISDNVRSDVRRCLGMVGYGADGNAIAHLGKQLVSDLERENANAPINRLRLEFPSLRTKLQSELEHELQLQLQRQDGEHVTHMFRRHAPLGRSGQRTTLWIDWGSFGSQQKQKTLTVGDIKTFLRFCSGYLTQHCPSDVRIVSYVGIQTSRDHSGIERKLQGLLSEPWAQSRGFSLRLLPPLDHVTLADLLEHLGEPDRSTCPQPIRLELGERLMTKTNGAFEATVELLERGEDGAWNEVLESLRREQGAQSTDDDEPLE